MVSGSFFIQRREDAVRHLQILSQGLKKVAQAGLVSGAGCVVLALLVGRSLGAYNVHAEDNPGGLAVSGMSLVIWLMAIALIGFSALYLIAGWGLSRRTKWARYTASIVFILKVLLCLWLGRTSLGVMFIFLLISTFDLYGLWVLLSKETEQLFTSPETTQASNPNRPQRDAGITEVNDVPRTPVG